MKTPFLKNIVNFIFFCLPVTFFCVNFAGFRSEKAIRLDLDKNPGPGLMQSACDGCVRRYVIANVSSDAGELNEHSIKNHLNNAVITPCFHALSTGDEIPRELRPLTKARPHEYFFMVSYEEEPEGKVKSRLQIDLFFNGTSEEHVESWTTETDNPDAKYTWHKNRMFSNPSAILRKFWPMEVTVLNGFEKQPYSCEIEPEKEAVNPEEEIEVVITDIHDIEGKPSREFNRLIVQAKNGEVLDGTPLSANFDLKAFRVGDGTVSFRYRAPSSCDEAEDTIFIYNSCDILREDLWPLAITDLNNKIAEKEIRLLCADWSGTFTFSYRSSSKEAEAVPGVAITTQKDIISHGSASLELYYDKEYDEFRVRGAPSGNYTHSYKEILTVRSGGSTARTEQMCRCSGGYTDEGPDERSFLDIRGKEYELQVTLTTDPDNDCKGTTKEYVDGKLVNTYGFADTFALSEFLEGLTDGKTIEGTKADSGEGWSSKLSWSFKRR